MYDQKNNNYFKNVRYDILSLISKGKNRILEIGAGAGNTLIYAKRNGFAEEIYGIDICKIEGSYQENDEMDGFVVGNIEEIELPFQHDYFDYIICADVLEHLVDPWAVLRKIKPYLKNGGFIVASLPNIRHYSVLKKILLEADFRYEEMGILDRTHLRFFCKKNMIEMFETAGYKVEQTTSINDFYAGPKRRIFDIVTFKLFDDFLASQYLLKAAKQ